MTNTRSVEIVKTKYKENYKVKAHKLRLLGCLKQYRNIEGFYDYQYKDWKTKQKVQKMYKSKNMYFTTYASLAKRLGYTVQHVRTLVKKLVEEGIISYTYIYEKQSYHMTRRIIGICIFIKNLIKRLAFYKELEEFKTVLNKGKQEILTDNKDFFISRATYPISSYVHYDDVFKIEDNKVVFKYIEVTKNDIQAFVDTELVKSIYCIDNNPLFIEINQQLMTQNKKHIVKSSDSAITYYVSPTDGSTVDMTDYFNNYHNKAVVSSDNLNMLDNLGF
jgi:DNA-binding Lrp family transcriptional regulator